VNDSINAIKRYLLNVANVTFDDSQVRVCFQKITEPHYVKHAHCMACRQQLWNEYGAFVATAASQEDIHSDSFFAKNQTVNLFSPDRTHAANVAIL
jgi:hypothetical protein